MPLPTTGEPGDWDAPGSGTEGRVFTVAGSLSRGFRGSRRLYGRAPQCVDVSASSTGLRRRYSPQGVEINAKRGDASA